jgi:hypothetical protein
MSPTGIIPEDLMKPSMRLQVMAFLIRLPIPGDDKLSLFIGWARMVGVTVNASQRNTVRRSGTDFAAPMSPASPSGGAA